MYSIVYTQSTQNGDGERGAMSGYMVKVPRKSDMGSFTGSISAFFLSNRSYLTIESLIICLLDELSKSAAYPGYPYATMSLAMIALP